MKCLIVDGGIVRVANPSKMSDGDTLIIDGKTYTARMNVKAFNEFQMSGDPDVVLQSLKEALAYNGVGATIEDRVFMEWFVYYTMRYADPEDTGFESFSTELEALDSINTMIEDRGAELEDFRLVHGEEKRLKAVSVVTRVAVD